MLGRQRFIDWMKAIGMFVIVTGHIIGSPHHIFNLITQPAFTKQLGVCFFIFIMGWSLANEKRNGFEVVYKRLFPIYFYGVAIAILLSLYYAYSINDINESNYLPFMLGANVLLNYFPANPTTWYIGTYLHVLVFWFLLLRGRRITKTHLVAGLAFEIGTRAVLLHHDIEFVAYMTLPNWLTVFLVGAYFCNKTDKKWSTSTSLILCSWLLFVAVWSSQYNTLISATSFPFRDMAGTPNLFVWSDSLQRSALISFIYIFNVVVFFNILRCAPELKIVKFFARNSLITFIIHMPLIYAFNQGFYSYFNNKSFAQWCFIIVIFVGCAILSESTQRLINIPYLQNKLWYLIKNTVKAK